MSLKTLRRILATTEAGRQFYKPNRNVARRDDFQSYRGLTPGAAELTRRKP